MAKNYFKKIRNAYTTGTLCTTLLSNIMVFGQPMQQMLFGAYAPGELKARIGKLLEASSENGPLSAEKTVRIFRAIQEEGIIGKRSENDRENPLDNFFDVQLPDSLNMDQYTAVLHYQLFGLAQAAHTTKSINNSLAYGGGVIETNASWTTVREVVPMNLLKPGKNEIFFTRRKDENYQYKIRNLRVELLPKTHEAIGLIGSPLTNFEGSVYVLGYVPDKKIDTLFIGEKPVAIHYGVFETIMYNIPKDQHTLAFHFPKHGNSKSHWPISYSSNHVQNFMEGSQKENGKHLVFGPNGGEISYRSIHFRLPSSNVPSPNAAVSVQGLGFKDLKILNGALKNVTAGKFLGYRANKLHIADSIPLQIRIAFDPEKIPEGYTARDVKTYYFDVRQKSWKALPVDSLDYEKKEIISTIYTETDFINGVIKVPESPETGSFAPTMLSEMKYADPGAGIVAIPPPSPNNMGSANTRFPLKLPKGRNGMQPSLSVSYNSEGGNGWMGIGWDLSVPAISLNTKWGVPLFDDIKETEVYSLNGSDLVLKNGGTYTSPHRDNTIPGPGASENETRFYSRVEGSYQQIIRHGNSPETYWWEVTDKQGNKGYYGGYNNGVVDNAVLKTEDGNIAHWALYRTEDHNGNYVEYTYARNETELEPAGDDGEPAIMGTEFYIDEIRYTMHSPADNHYEVDFVRNNYTLGNTQFNQRPEKMINARNGLIQFTDDLLTEIHISYVENSISTPIRSYRFGYTTSTFGKSLLERISEYDAAGNLFYSNTMEYYNEVDSNIISNTDTWNGTSHDISSVLLDIATGGLANEIPMGSSLGTSVSNGFSAGLRVGVGIGWNSGNVSNTIGGSFSYSQSNQKTKISFVDINGDGLSDKVYANNSDMYYSPNTGEGFGEVLPIMGADELSKTKSRTTGGGADANLLGLLGVGKSWSKTKSTTDNYFADFNGDGLIDIVSDYHIKFNTTQPNADTELRQFDTNVGLSENPIVSGQLDMGLLNDFRLESLLEIKDQHPQYDHVKIWRAPYSGIIDIANHARLVAENDDGEHINRFRLTVERTSHDNPDEATQIGNEKILEAPSPSFTYFNRNNIDVNKGDVFFFRIHNMEYGYGGGVEWNPVITYDSFTTFPYTTQTDENDKSRNSFDSEADFVMNNGGSWSADNDTETVEIDFNLDDNDFDPFQFSDEIRFVVEKIEMNTSDGSEAVVHTWTKTYLPATGNFSWINPISENVDVPGFKYSFNFKIESDSNVAWDTIEWNPIVTVNNSTEEQFPPVNFIPYENNVLEQKYWFDASDLPEPEIDENIPNDGDNHFLVLNHNLFNDFDPFFLNGLSEVAFPIKINWVTKEKINGITETLNKRTFYLHRFGNAPFFVYLFSQSKTDIIPTIDDDESYILSKSEIEAIRNAPGPGKIYSAFYVDNENIGFSSNVKINLAIHPDEENNYPNWGPLELHAPFMAISPTFFGHTYRGWGQFLYNGGIYLERDENHEVLLDGFGQPNILADFGTEVIDVSQFDLGSYEEATNVDPETDPEDVAASGEPLRYTLYAQDNQNDTYRNPAIFDALYHYNNGDLTATVGRFGEANLYDIYITQADLIGNNDPGVFLGLKQRSESKGSAEMGNLVMVTGTHSESGTDVLNQYIDLNGDRYPDIVTDGHIQFTGMLGGLMPNSSIQNHFVAGNQNIDNSEGVSLAGIKKNSDVEGVQYLENPLIMNTKAGIGHALGRTFDSRQWADMNGDGLPDKVRITDSQVRVWLNTGHGFSDNMILWGSGYSGLITSSRENFSGSTPSITPSFALGFGIATGKADIQTSLIDVNGDGLPELVIKQGGGYKYFLNTGAGFEENLNTFYGGAKMDQNISYSGNIFGSFSAGPVIPIPPVFVIAIKIVFSPSAGLNAALNETAATVGDINGDGLPDVLHKLNDNASVTAHLNSVGKTHLLKKVNTPLGGSWEITYERAGNTYELPQNKYVLNEVRTYDGFTGDSNFGPDETVTAISYENPHYDRRERSFFGFETVKTDQLDGNGDIYRYTVKKFHTDNYYLKGRQKSEALYNASGGLLTQKETLYNLLDPDDPDVYMDADADNHFLQDGLNADLLDHSRLFVAVARVLSTSYENGTSGPIAQQYFTAYDAHGNILEYIDHGTGGDDAYKTSITYYTENDFPNLDNANGFPKKIEVHQENSGELLRRREAQYSNYGNLSKVLTTLNDGEKNTVLLNYDFSGLLTSIGFLDSQNDAGEYFIQHIHYDDQVNTYPVLLTNSFGEESTSVYNVLFGVPVLTTDMNGESMRTYIDNRGRIVEVTGPNELAWETANGQHGWTIRQAYEGQSVTDQIENIGNGYVVQAEGSFEAADPGSGPIFDAQHYAVTRHIDPENDYGGNQFLTISIVDGFGQAVQLKKTHESNTTKWLISGKEKKDAFGRVFEAYMPTNGTYPSNLNALQPTDLEYVGSISSLPPTLMEYDARNRKTSIQQPGEGQAAHITYGIEGGMFTQEAVNERDQSMKTFTDVRGRKRKTVANGVITTEFDYNAVNEPTSVLHTDGTRTNYLYDLAGRKTEIQQPDRGVIMLKYDKAGNVTERKTSNLIDAGQNQAITYHYTFGRLDKIEYPTPQNNVTYRYGEPGDNFAEGANAVGRLLFQKDASGVQVFGYGRMGELNRNIRSVAVAGRQSYWFVTRWEYDSWNRVQQIVYPDREVVDYAYNKAGSLRSISSEINGVPDIDDIISNITYTDYGEEAQIIYGNGARTTYDYDQRRRMNDVKHEFEFGAFEIEKVYTYDALSNIENIVTNSPQNSLPGFGELGGPTTYDFEYDEYNRLITASGSYTGPNDLTTPYLKQEFRLNMEYNSNHAIVRKELFHQQGSIANYGSPISSPHTVGKTSYNLQYEDYGSGAFVLGSNYNYVQPNAPRTITETPVGISIGPNDPRKKVKTIEYDANGNQTKITEKVGEEEIPLLENLWDAENRLTAVDLDPGEESDHPVAIYTYDAAGQRAVKYNWDRLDIFSNANKVAQEQGPNTLLYPNGLVVAKVLPPGVQTVTYSKYYYVGARRVASRTGSTENLGPYLKGLEAFFPSLNVTGLRQAANQSVTNAGEIVQNVFDEFEIGIPLSSPIVEGVVTRYVHDASLLDTYYFHSDHLGSSNYITNEFNIVTQHMEYMPFGEMLVEEHLNSNNEPFKFNGKELDEETGNYYYGARYYNPKWSIWLSVDPLAEKFPWQSPYVFTNNNPINFIDPDGRAAISLNGPPNEYNVDKNTGDITKISDKGGNETDYYNVGTTNTEGEFQTDQTITVDREEGTINSFRFEETENSTTSTFNIPENETEGYMLEPAGPSTKTPNQDQRIPEGQYNLEDYSSAKYPNNFILFNKDVSKSRKILLHIGNFPSNTEGCLMPGCSFGTDFVGSSGKKFGEMRTYIQTQGAENIKLNIFNIIP